MGKTRSRRLKQEFGPATAVPIFDWQPEPARPITRKHENARSPRTKKPTALQLETVAKLRLATGSTKTFLHDNRMECADEIATLLRRYNN